MNPALVWIIVCGVSALLALIAALARVPALAGVLAITAAAAALVSVFVSVGTAALS